MSVPRENAVVRCKTLIILRERNAFELISDARDAFRKTVVDTRQREREKKKEKEIHANRDAPPIILRSRRFLYREGVARKVRE